MPKVITFEIGLFYAFLYCAILSGLVRSRTGVAKATGPIFIHLARTASQQEGLGEFNEIQEDPQK